MQNWAEIATFYHIYPLGFCGAPQYNENEITHRITKLKDWIPHIKEMGFNALYLGPLFESFEHGYDTSNYQLVDHRLGDNNDVIDLCNTLKDSDIRIVFDGVFNHVGREFWAFKDVLKNRSNSPYCDWFSNLRFDTNNAMNDGFAYDTWQGYHNLIKLNLKNEDVINHILDSVGMWMDIFHIDGIRLDAADCIDPNFFKRLKEFCKEKQSDFWLMGEIIHGDYTMWANQEMLDSVTNYECYKGLYSSLNDKNYFEIAHSLNRQFAKGGIYESLHLYNFVDNHDVNRIASTLVNKQDLLNIYTLLYTMPGIPSVYYGSEWEVEGRKHDGSDADIRPCLSIDDMCDTTLTSHIKKLNIIRKEHVALYHGNYEAISIKNEQFIFTRTFEQNCIYVALNVSDQIQLIELKTKGLVDIIHDTCYPSKNNIVTIPLLPKSSCILVMESFEKPKDEEIYESCSAPVIEKQAELIQSVLETKQDESISLNNQPLKLGRYQHMKGKHYAVLYIATHSETLEPMVVYRQLYGDESVWVRPLSMFMEEVDVDGVKIPRFKYIGK